MEAGGGVKRTKLTEQFTLAQFRAANPGAVPLYLLDPSGVLSMIVADAPVNARAGQTLSVNYVGVSMTTGKEFDSSWSRNEPFSFQVGTGSVIQGWDQGLVGVPVGSRVQLDIPTDLAYGANPPSQDVAGPLRFVVDVLSAQ